MNEIITTSDGSHSLFSKAFDETYHSEQGAVSESLHVFVNRGFQKISKNDISILEIGFGTGLNLFLTLIENSKIGKKIYYQTIEKYPVEIKIIEKLNYSGNIGISKHIFLEIHNSDWEKIINADKNFRYKKINDDITKIEIDNSFDIVYFDAFSPETQEELWTQNIFEKIYRNMNKGGILLTYSAKGIVKQNLRKAGFTVKRQKGFGTKHHMIEAIKE